MKERWVHAKPEADKKQEAWFDGWLEGKFEQARELDSPNPPPAGLYLALLAYPLSTEDSQNFISYLRLPKAIAQTLRDTASIKATLEPLENPSLAPSHIYRLLHGYSHLAITANLLATDSPTARQHIHLYLDKLRYVRTTLTGDDLIRMGIPPGPRIKEILNRLHKSRLDGEIKDKQGEEEVIRELVAREE